MLSHEVVVGMCEKYTKQLEGLAYSKNRDLAIKLTGAIDACVQISQVHNTWNSRIDQAMAQVMADPPKPQDMKLGAIPSLPTLNPNTPPAVPATGVPQLIPSAPAPSAE